MVGYHIQFNMINFKKVGIIFLASSFILSSCTTKDNSNSSTPIEEKEIKAISLEYFTKNLSNSEYQFIDTRDDEAYNGFKVDNVKNGGHLKNLIQYSASFIGKVNKNKEAKFISDKGLDKNKKIVIYDTNKDNIEKVSDKFASLGYEVYKFEDYKTFADNDANKANIIAYPEYDIARAKEMSEKAQKEGIKLVSIRSWDEYTGKTSGYDYIDKKGEPKGAVYGFSGTDAANMDDYYDPDGTLRNPQEIYNLWKGQGISETDKIAVYCGTGWRNSIPWFMTQLTGRANTYFYDGGWNDWQLEGSLPVDENKDKGAKPDAKNDFK